MSLRRSLVLVLCFCSAGLLIHAKQERDVERLNHSLGEHFGIVGGWRFNRNIPMEEGVATSLDLDDYLFREYTDGENVLTLYVGYYISANKVGAAHDPLVCFPAQGWVVDEMKKGAVKFTDGTRAGISYSSMVAERNGERVLVLYWFQSYDSAVADTFSQKLLTLWNTWKHRRMDSTLVRISVPMNGISQTKAYELAHSFIQPFYADLVRHIQRESDQPAL